MKLGLRASHCTQQSTETSLAGERAFCSNPCVAGAILSQSMSVLTHILWTASQKVFALALQNDTPALPHAASSQY
jgi:hypothetical protein